MGKSKSRLIALSVAVLFSAGVFWALYQAARNTVLDEIRAQAMGVAMATSAGIQPEDVQAIQNREDMARPPFQRIQQHLTRVSRYNEDVRYLYVMRRNPAPEARPTDYLFVVDQEAEDLNRNGNLDEDERSEPTGQIYDASDLPAMVAAWNAPAADREPAADPPYPDLISGYAPIRDASGATVGIVGADITARTIGEKMFMVRAVTSAGFLIVTLLVVGVFCLYFNQRDLAEERERLVHELQEALGNIRTLSGLLPICSSCKRIRNDGGDWERLESFVGRRSHAEFSHSICPECTDRLYPESTKN